MAFQASFDMMQTINYTDFDLVKVIQTTREQNLIISLKILDMLVTLQHSYHKILRLNVIKADALPKAESP